MLSFPHLPCKLLTGKCHASVTNMVPGLHFKVPTGYFEKNCSVVEEIGELLLTCLSEDIVNSFYLLGHETPHF